ncbi:MAG: lysophospholipid acyltransferase family protein [Flavobacteriales bacterium]|nr:lysophospholipid acyltransferase family protein [Flavobacteriales bacterium]
MFWKIVTPLVVVLLFTWTAICFVPTFIFRFLLFNEKVFGFVAKYIWSPGILFLSFASVRVNGRKNIPKGENFIFTCNHESILDIPALFYASPTFLYFIAKNELKKVPFIGWSIWAAGMIFIDRNNRKKAMNSMREAGVKALKQKKDIVSFPEGTRGNGRDIRPFKRGTFIISKQADIRIVPCSISGAYRVWPSDQLKLKPGKIKVNFGEPVDPKDHADKSDDEFAAFIRSEIIKLKTTPQ